LTLDDKIAEAVQLLQQLKEPEDKKMKNNRKVIYLSKEKSWYCSLIFYHFLDALIYIKIFIHIVKFDQMISLYFFFFCNFSYIVLS